MEAEGPSLSLPPNYVTIQQLKERWLRQHDQNPPSPQLPNSKDHDHDHDSHSHLNPKPNHEAALKPVPRRNPYSPRPNHHRMINESRPEVKVDDSHSKTEVDVEDNHPKGEQEHKTEHSNSKLAKKKKGPKTRKPRVVTDQNPNGGGTPLLEPEPVEGKKPFQPIGGRRSRSRSRSRSVNQKVVWEPKDETAPLAQKVDELSQDDARADGVVEAAAAAIIDRNIPSVSRGTGKSGVSGRFQGKPKPKPWSGSNRPSKPPFSVKQGQTSLVWVKKGESATN